MVSLVSIRIKCLLKFSCQARYGAGPQVGIRLLVVTVYLPMIGGRAACRASFLLLGRKRLRQALCDAARPAMCRENDFTHSRYHLGACTYRRSREMSRS